MIISSYLFSVSLSGRSNASTMQIIARSEFNLLEAYGNGKLKVAQKPLRWTVNKFRM
jgi:hypothetical protein